MPPPCKIPSRTSRYSLQLLRLSSDDKATGRFIFFFGRTGGKRELPTTVGRRETAARSSPADRNGRLLTKTYLTPSSARRGSHSPTGRYLYAQKKRCPGGDASLCTGRTVFEPDYSSQKVLQEENVESLRTTNSQDENSESKNCQNFQKLCKQRRAEKRKFVPLLRCLPHYIEAPLCRCLSGDQHP